ncbi:MAG: HepT-like ribonuclease domain-containing protein [Campylobacterota bacterium]|nr:HepT-like ribonuclease domain-containing protein [Campylobacterota bacterium]
MSKELLALKTIIESIEKINLYSSPSKNADDFYHDSKSFDATMIHFINIGEMIERISPQFKESYSHIPWREIKDFRNLVSHNYFGIDADELWDIIINHLPTLKTNIHVLIKDLETV